ncbi:cupin domain-containing protein [Nannocystis punicea]|uniref:Cupin domain-containing protein n=1 Tax=Nannocystis punicea TaxID=2995304 RepID=A0ABY7HBW4_9BACT|nr:cupin domain-containing protein [Nannocystis poenicansa]WAS96773.1 cupin domain-containing protein [Nannocystis poenicansa]
MSDSGTATHYVLAPEDLAWHETELGRNFSLSQDLVATDYTSAYSAQVTKFGPGGGSPPHSHTYNHAFYFLSGTCRVKIGEQTWQIRPGTFVKVPAHAQHSVTNIGAEDLVFLVIYDPPHADGTP